MDLNRLNEVLLEHVGIEDEILEKFQALRRNTSLGQIGQELGNLIQERSSLTERVQVLERKLAATEEQKHEVGSENQRLHHEISTLRERFDKGHAKSLRSEQIDKKIIEDYENCIETLQRDKHLLESKLDEAIDNHRREAELDMERIRKFTEENSRLKEEIHQEKAETYKKDHLC